MVKRSADIEPIKNEKTSGGSCSASLDSSVSLHIFKCLLRARTCLGSHSSRNVAFIDFCSFSSSFRIEKRSVPISFELNLPIVTPYCSYIKTEHRAFNWVIRATVLIDFIFSGLIDVIKLFRCLHHHLGISWVIVLFVLFFSTCRFNLFGWEIFTTVVTMVLIMGWYQRISDHLLPFVKRF